MDFDKPKEYGDTFISDGLVYFEFCGPVGCQLKERFFHKRNLQLYIGMQLYHLFLRFHEAKENFSFD